MDTCFIQDVFGKFMHKYIILPYILNLDQPVQILLGGNEATKNPDTVLMGEGIEDSGVTTDEVS